MAGRGPAPKAEQDRVRRARPARGEWRELEAIDPKKPYLPRLPPKRPDGRPWLAATKDVWKGYQLDPVTRTFTPADIQSALRLALLTDNVFQGAKCIAELRHGETLLGLNPKGKRDLRLRVPGADAAEVEEPRGQLVGIDGGKISARDQALGLVPDVRPPTAET